MEKAPDTYGFAMKEVPLFEALWTCNIELKNLEEKSFIKRIFLFTDEECPMKGDAESQKRTKDYSEVSLFLISLISYL